MSRGELISRDDSSFRICSADIKIHLKYTILGFTVFVLVPTT